MSFDRQLFDALQNNYRSSSIQLVALTHQVREAVEGGGDVAKAVERASKQADAVIYALNNLMDVVEGLP